MRIGFCADCHIANHRQFGGQLVSGLNERCRLCLDVLANALKRAGECGCADVVILGDLFDSDRPSPQEVAAVQYVIYRSNIRVSMLVGNHDKTSEAPGDHALAPLWQVANVYERPSSYVVPDGIKHGTTLLHVPWQPGPAYDW